MRKVLVLGAGLVSRPLVRYLLNLPDFSVTVATRTVSKADQLVAGHPRGRTTALLSEDTATLEKLVHEHDLAVSLLPAPQHPVVAELCVKHKKHMVTTSYVSPKMKAFDGPARAAGVTLLNEIGVDPGIDHMSAMRIIHAVRKRGGAVVSFKSYCGGLPAPEANTNPWGYKFSWSPRGVCTAAKNAARWRENGKQVDVRGPELFTCHHPVPVAGIPGIKELEGYPNRDSLSYIDVYGLAGIETMFRGTLRYPGWCVCLKAVVDLGMLDETPVTYPRGMTFAQWTAGLIKPADSVGEHRLSAGELRLPAGDAPGGLRRQTAQYLKNSESANLLDRLEWLGVFSNDPLPIVGQPTTRLDILATRMNEKMPYGKGERDMLVLLHQFVARFPGRGGAGAAPAEEHISSTMIDFGEPNGDTSMARTVSLPAAIGVKLILTGKIQEPGVHVPVKPAIYNPVLDELATMKIRCVEKTTKA